MNLWEAKLKRWTGVHSLQITNTLTIFLNIRSKNNSSSQASIELICSINVSTKQEKQTFDTLQIQRLTYPIYKVMDISNGEVDVLLKNWK